jgi:hypothetical protein
MKTYLKYLNDNKRYREKIKDKVNFSVKVPAIAIITGNNNRINVDISYKKNAVNAFNRAMFKNLRPIVKDMFGFSIESNGPVESSINNLETMKCVFTDKNNNEKGIINDKQDIFLNLNVLSNSMITVEDDDYDATFDFNFIIDGVDNEIKNVLGSKYNTIKNGKSAYKKENKHITITFEKRPYEL